MPILMLHGLMTYARIFSVVILAHVLLQSVNTQCNTISVMLHFHIKITNICQVWKVREEGT